MPEHHKVSLLLVGNQHRRLGMPQKYRLLSLIVICFTLLFFTWMIRDSLCELGNDSNLLIVFYVQIMPDDFVMQLHRF